MCQSAWRVSRVAGVARMRGVTSRGRRQRAAVGSHAAGRSLATATNVPRDTRKQQYKHE
ncbi:hypothetical protein JYU34_008960 [Plutella xylostella]|uniref:Uncharacterized protein n=1 Tax=Plutella xylostella TaxID=51655 RepID=A0ABQ7QMC6_PLUXY|nr:hypothetical protein JYU34_008960 [Plutella xylostella]